jgi:hypothetical protein
MACWFTSSGTGTDSDSGVVDVLGADDLDFAVPIDISSHDPLAAAFQS